MVLDRLSIVNYKNLRAVDVEFSPGVNCLIGNNGEGKTNLLDAVYFLSFCRSSVTAETGMWQLITHGEDLMSIEGAYSHGILPAGEAGAHLSPLKVSCGLRRGGRKVFRRDGKVYKRLSEHVGLIPLVLATPRDTVIVDGASEWRRHFMDMVISQYDRNYLVALASYNRALQQRNAILRQLATGSRIANPTERWAERGEAVGDDSLELWEMEMARHGEVVYRKRGEFIAQFMPFLQRIYNFISDGKEAISLSYVSHCQRGPLLDVIQRDRMRDYAAGYSLHGIHRDDLELLLDGYNMRREGSQGQNKTFALAMKFAQFEFLSPHHGAPILLLDDIFDKLDAGRVERIVSLVSGEGYGQIFITDTNREHLDRILSSSMSDYSLFRVEKGQVAISR